MADTVREFFDGLEARADESKTSGINNSYLFDVDGAGRWTVDVHDGKLTVAEGGDSADCEISVTEENFEKILAGEQNATTAYMTGKIKIKGDMGAAMKLQKLLS